MNFMQGKFYLQQILTVVLVAIETITYSVVLETKSTNQNQKLNTICLVGKCVDGGW